MKSSFRPDINVLRAIAVLGVVFYHFHIPGFGGGFAGVDVFFVISGYLMSRIIISGFDKGTFSLLTFYLNRARRIIPALYAMIFLLLLTGYFIFFPGEYRFQALNSVASLLFYSNILYWRTSGYFDPGLEQNALLHTWSLSLEWQFYLVYPLLLIAILRQVKSRILFLVLIAAGCLGSFLLSLFIVRDHAMAAFYGLPTRAWEMLFGCLALLLSNRNIAEPKKKALAISGYAGVVLCFAFINPGMLWPGIFALLPVFFTFLVIASGATIKPVNFRPLQFLGTISYSLYLYHWPVFIYAIYLGIEFGTLSILVLLVLAIALGWLSFRYVESVQLKNWKIALPSMLTCLAVALLASSGRINAGLFKPSSLHLSEYQAEHKDEHDQQFSDSCFDASARSLEFSGFSCLKIKPGMRNFLLIGDSHAAEFSETLSRALAPQHIHLVQATASGCFPLLKPQGVKSCALLMHYMYTTYLVRHHAELEGVIIAAHWMRPEKDWNHTLLPDLKATLAYVKSQGLKAIIIGQTESYTIPYSAIAAREEEYGVSIRKKYVDDGSLKMNELLRAAFAPCYVEILNSGDVPAPSQTLAPYMVDEDHMSSYGAGIATAKILNNPIAKALFDLNR